MSNNFSQKLNLNKLRNKKEKFYFRVHLVLAVLLWAWIFSPIGIPFLTETAEFSFTALATTAIFLIGIQLLLTYFSLWAMANIRMNGIKVGPNQYPQLYKVSNEISEQLGLTEIPAIFIINSGGILNAFAAKLALRRIIVLYSDLVDALTTEKDDKQLRAVLTHELGHHALGHCEFWINYFISPVGIFYTLSNALSRAREYSADNVMREVINDEEVCSRALIKLAGGGKVGQKANLNAYMEQSKEEAGFFSWLARIHSTHPFLPDRIKAVNII